MLEKIKSTFKTSASKNSVKNKLISYSLMWMGLGVMIIFLMSYLVLSVPEISNIFIRIANEFWIILLIVNMALILGLSFFAQRLSLKMLILMYIVFILVEGLFLSTTLYYFGFGVDNNNGIKNLFLLFLAPSSIFIVMGFLGWFQIFDFSKIAPFLFFATIGLIIFSILLLFFGGPRAEKWYSLFGIIIFSLWIGFDIWWIQRTATEIESSGNSNEELVRIGLIFGIRLFIDFVNLLIYFARLIR
ncbi:MAG: Bax inhibitor-1 family protein [Mycoplasmataceae bacterium]|nr:Bax inhibitor-1 family protein [Mycoplasmataceae bacterium]